jgi:hypothetical protein
MTPEMDQNTFAARLAEGSALVSDVGGVRRSGGRSTPAADLMRAGRPVQAA